MFHVLSVDSLRSKVLNNPHSVYFRRPQPPRQFRNEPISPSISDFCAAVGGSSGSRGTPP